MLVIFFCSLFALSCKEDIDTPLPGATLVGEWKMEKIIFETDISTSELALPASYPVTCSIAADGNYSFVDNGQVKTHTWRYQEDTKTLLIRQDDQTEVPFSVVFSEDGLSWSYVAYQLDLTTALSPDEAQVKDFILLVGLSKGESLTEAKVLTVNFVMTKQK